MTPVEVVDGMLELLADESRWTKSVNARDAEGHKISPTAKSAACWCLFGARVRVTGRIPPWDTADDVAAKRRGFDSSSSFNDAPETTHADVLNLLREVRAELQGAA